MPESSSQKPDTSRTPTAPSPTDAARPGTDHDRQAGELTKSFALTPSVDASRSAPTACPAISGYEILALLGRGGMGVVYQARQLGLNRLVALKMVVASSHTDDGRLARFRSEAEAVARLQHPHIVQIHEIGTADGCPYLCLEYVDGGSLSVHLTGAPQPARWSATLVRTLALAVEHAHRHGVVHRDLKPSNVLLTRDGTPKVADFGLAKQIDDDAAGQTQTGVILGTPSYMAPEQAAGRVREVGPAADVYALGAILYEALTGRPPFRGETMLDTLEQVRTQEPVPPARLQPKVPRDLETICLKCLQKEPRKRYASAAGLADDLGRFLAGAPIQARPVGLVERSWRWCRRYPALAAALAGIVLALALGTAASWLFAAQAMDNAAAAETNAGRADREAKTARVNETRAKEKEALAKNNERLAKKNEALAKQNEQTARDNELMAKRRHYVAEMNLANRECQAGQMHLAVARLQAQIPRGPGDPDLRGFEWYYLMRQCLLDLWTLRSETPPAPPLPLGVTQLAPHPILFSANGRWLVSGETDCLAVWDVRTGSKAASVYARATPLAITDDGARIATSRLRFAPRPGGMPGVSAADQFVSIWDTATGKEICSLKQILGVAVSLDGRRLATASHQCIEIRDITRGVVTGTIRTQAGIVRPGNDWPRAALALNRDGTLLASTGPDTTVGIWDTVISQPILMVRKACSELSLSPSGRQLATANGQTMTVWNTITGQEACTIHGNFGYVQQRDLLFNEDGTRIASANNAPLRLWDSNTGKEIVALPRNRAGWILSKQSFSADGRLLAVPNDHGVSIWDAVTGQHVRTLYGHTRPVTEAAFCPDGRRLATSSSDRSDRTVKIWLANMGLDAMRLHWDAPVQIPRIGMLGVGFSPDGTQVVTAGSQDAILRIWDTASGQPVRVIGPNEAAVGAGAFGADDKTLASAYGGMVSVWDVPTAMKRLTRVLHLANDVAFSPDGKRFAASGRSQTVKVWDALTGDEKLTLHGEPNSFGSVAFSPNGQRIAAGGDHHIKVWDAITGREIFTLLGSGVVAFSPNGKWLAAGSADDSVTVWDAASGKEAFRFRGHTDRVGCVAFTPDSRRLASAGGDGTVRLWDMITGQEVLALGWPSSAMTGAVRRLAFSRDGKRLAGAGVDGVRIWDATPLSPDLQVQRDACSLVQFLFDKPLLRDEVLAAIRQDPTISEPVRALALTMAASTIDQPGRLNNASWDTVVRQDASMEEYRRALVLAEAASRLAPKNPQWFRFYQRTLAAARFRAGLVREALAILPKELEGLPETLAFIALVQQQLGNKAEAQAAVQRLRQLMVTHMPWLRAQKGKKAIEESLAHLAHEAEEAVEGKTTRPSATPDLLVVTKDTVLDPHKRYGRLIIAASNITIDGQGATLVGPGTGKPNAFTGTAISAKSVAKVTLKNISARGWDIGLAVADGSGWHIENCNFSDNFHDPDFGWGQHGRHGGIVLDYVHKSTIRKCRANRVWDGCLLADCNDNVIEDNDFAHTSNTCLSLRRSSRNTVRNNKLDYGIRIKPGEVHARDSTCVLIETGSNDNRFLDNSCTHGGDGIFIRVLDGWVSTDNVFERNDCSYANNNCFEAWSPRNRYIGNKANHGSYGFWLGASDQTLLVDNEASFNGDAKGHHNSPHLPENGHAGIVFMFGPSSHTIVRGNKCIGNNGAGIALIGDQATRGKSWKAFHWIIEQNTLTGNRWGIYAQHADWVDVAANIFKDNHVKDVFVDNVTNLTQRPDKPKISQPPRAVVTGPAFAKVGQIVVLNGSASTDPGGNPLQFRWDLGDGTIARTARVEHAFKTPGFYRVGVTVNNGLLSDLGWRDFYVVDEREESATEGQASQWAFQDDWQRSKVVFTDDRAVKLAGTSSLHAEVNPYSGARLRLLYPTSKNAGWSVKGKTHVAFWLKVVKEHPWQDANPEITLYETDKKFTRLVPRREVLGSAAVNEAREGWWYVVVPLAGDDLWQRQGQTLETINYLSIGFDTWEYGPLRIWLDGLHCK